MKRSMLATIAIGMLAVFAACGGTGPYVDVASLPPGTTSQGDVVIQDGDTVNVRVFNQEPLSTREKVRADGRISMPVIGEVTARGKKPAQLAQEIQVALTKVLQAPSVSVVLEQGGEFRISVVGEVRNAGVFQLEPGANVLHALAAAGGLSDYADGDKIFVIRRSLSQRVRFKYADLRSADPKSIQFVLHSGDVVVVE